MGVGMPRSERQVKVGVLVIKAYGQFSRTIPMDNSHGQFPWTMHQASSLEIMKP
jgi:hypothetical protein